MCVTTLRRTLTLTSNKRPKMNGMVYVLRAIEETTACRTNDEGSYSKWKMKIFVTSFSGSSVSCSRVSAFIAWTRTFGDIS